jgi:hypothetical protein
VRRRSDLKDVTGSAAVTNVSGETLLASVLDRIDDELDRVLVLAHIALDLPLTPLARDLQMSSLELARRADRALNALRSDGSLAAQLGDLQRVGQLEHYQALAFRLNLQNWFCGQCAGLMVQRGVGRPRETCSPRCRRLRYEADLASWKDQYSPGTAISTLGDPIPLEQVPALDTPERLEKLKSLMRWTGGNWQHPNFWLRGRAILLLGFACPIPLTPSDLAALNINDIRMGVDSLEMRLFKNSDARPTRYVTLPKREDEDLCPFRAIARWRQLQTRKGQRAGPLFIVLNRNNTIPQNPRHMTGRAITNMVNELLWIVDGASTFECGPITPLTTVLDQLDIRSTAPARIWETGYRRPGSANYRPRA